MERNLLLEIATQIEGSRTEEEIEIAADGAVVEFEELAGMIDWYLKTNINLEQSKRDIAMRIADNAEKWANATRNMLRDSANIRDIVNEISYWIDNQPEEVEED